MWIFQKLCFEFLCIFCFVNSVLNLDVNFLLVFFFINLVLFWFSFKISLWFCSECHVNFVLNFDINFVFQNVVLHFVWNFVMNLILNLFFWVLFWISFWILFWRQADTRTDRPTDRPTCWSKLPGRLSNFAPFWIHCLDFCFYWSSDHSFQVVNSPRGLRQKVCHLAKLFLFGGTVPLAPLYVC